MPDSVDIIADLTGLQRAELLGQWKRVQANQALLTSCAWHDFEKIEPWQPIRGRWRCRHCGGEINSSAWHWHEVGRRPRPDAPA